MTTLDICLAGATGWAGAALAKAVHEAEDLRLVSAVARKTAGKNLGAVLGLQDLDVPIFSDPAEAIAQGASVFFDYTKPDAARGHVHAALENGCHVIVGTSGLTDADYAGIDTAAQAAGLGVLAVGNFALTVVLLQKFAEMAAQYIPHWEIIDYAHSHKVDAPSGTAREIAARLGKVRDSQLDVPLNAMSGPVESRGVRLNGSQVHALRLPGYTISLDVIFGMPDQKLTLRHDSGTSAAPYVDGALLAIRKVSEITGLKRGLDSVMDF